MKWRIIIAIVAMLGVAGVAPTTDLASPTSTKTAIVYTNPGTDGCEVCWD
jgi:hypothetical protein